MVVKNRNLIFVTVLSLITFGIYFFYWFYSTRKELYEINKKDGNAIIDLIMLFIPFVNFYAFWKYCGDVELISKGTQGKVLLFILMLIFFPAYVYLTQQEINKFASA